MKWCRAHKIVLVLTPGGASPANGANCSQGPLRRRVAHQFAQRLIVRINAPFCNLPTLHQRAPRRRHFPEPIRTEGRLHAARRSRRWRAVARLCARAERTDVAAARRSENCDAFIGYEEFFGVNLIVGDHLEILSPALTHRFAAHETLAERILKNVTLRHQFTERIDVTRVDAFDEVHRDLERLRISVHEISRSWAKVILNGNTRSKP